MWVDIIYFGSLLCMAYVLGAWIMLIVKFLNDLIEKEGEK